MVILTAVLMLAVLPFVILSVYVGITGLPESYYDRTAGNRAQGEYYTKDNIPDKVTILGRDIAVDREDIDVSQTINTASEKERYQNLMAITQFTSDRLRYKKAMIEQALINTCVTLQTRCKQDAVDLLWAFLPASKGSISTIGEGGLSSTLDCATATHAEYARHGRYLFKTVIPADFFTDPMARNIRYSKPSGNTGCSFHDLVDID